MKNKYSLKQFSVLRNTYSPYKSYIKKIVYKIRKNQPLQVWYLENSGRLAYFDGVTLNSGNSTGTKLIYVQEKSNSDPSIFGFVPTSPRILLIR